MVFLRQLSAQTNEITFKIPKKMSLELGYRVTPSGWIIANTKLSSNTLAQGVFPNQPANALVARAEFAWQLAGFASNKPAVYLGLPISLGFLFDGTRPPFSTTTVTSNGLSYAGTMSLDLSYGFCIRHDLTPSGHAFKPFLAYELLVNQLFFEGTVGKILGHETRFDIGCEFRERGQVGWLAQLYGAYTSYGELGRYESFHQFTLGISVGVTYH